LKRVVKRRGRDDLPAEHPFRFFVDDREIATLMATPELLDELAVGWLWSNDLIGNAADVKKLLVDIERSIIWAEISGRLPERLSKTISSGCGGGTVLRDLTEAVPPNAGRLKLSLPSLSQLFSDFFRRANIYKKTGGVHGAAIASPEGVVFVAEDLGRHNAVDKIIGWAVINEMALSDKIVLTTGRISSDMLFKSAKAGFQIIASRTAATDLAVKLATAAGITIAGYVKGDKAVVYCHDHRLT
jgi:FdhD protein